MAKLLKSEMAAKLRLIPVRPHDRRPFFGRDGKSSELPWPVNPLPRSNRKKTACQRLRLQHSLGARGNSRRDGADSDANALWCQEKRLQDIVVRLRWSSAEELRFVEDRPNRNSPRARTGKEIVRTLVAY